LLTDGCEMRNSSAVAPETARAAERGEELQLPYGERKHRPSPFYNLKAIASHHIKSRCGGSPLQSMQAPSENTADQGGIG